MLGLWWPGQQSLNPFNQQKRVTRTKVARLESQFKQGQVDESLINKGVEEYAALGSSVEEIELYATKEMI